MWLDLPDQGSGGGHESIMERRTRVHSFRWSTRARESVENGISPSPVSEEVIAGFVLYRLENGVVEYLLLKKIRQNDWTPPKGHVEAGEDCLEGAERETEEETRFSAADYETLEQYPIYFEYLTRQRVLKRVNLWAAKYLNPDKVVRLSPEHDEFQWLDYEAALAVTKRQYKEALMAADLVIRTHESL